MSRGLTQQEISPGSFSCVSHQTKIFHTDGRGKKETYFSSIKKKRQEKLTFSHIFPVFPHFPYANDKKNVFLLKVEEQNLALKRNRDSTKLTKAL